MPVRLCSFVVWAIVAFSVVAWLLQLSVASPGVPIQAVPVGMAVEVSGDWSRLLGVPPPVVVEAVAVPEQSSRFKLAGVMAPRASRSSVPSSQGVALISVDGKPARAFRVGASIDGDLRLQSVGQRMASLGPLPGGRSLVLELPLLPPPATGVLQNSGAANPSFSGQFPQRPGFPATPNSPVGPVSPMVPMSPQGTFAPPQSGNPAESAQ